MDFTAIKAKVYFLTKSNSETFDIDDLVPSANNAVERVSSLIAKNDSRWQFDSTEQTDLPIATAALVSGQKDYGLDISHLTIDRVEVKDSSSNWHLLSPIDQSELKRDKATPLSSYKSSNGIPEEYDLIGNSIFLYPSPNYSQAASLKVYFTRGPVAFTSSSSSATPGFNSLFHELVPLWVAYEFALANELTNGQLLLDQIMLKERELEEFYALRNRDVRARLTVSRDSNK